MTKKECFSLYIKKSLTYRYVNTASILYPITYPGLVDFKDWIAVIAYSQE